MSWEGGVKNASYPSENYLFKVNKKNVRATSIGTIVIYFLSALRRYLHIG